MSASSSEPPVNVYRLETEDGTGVYTSGAAHAVTDNVVDVHDRHDAAGNDLNPNAEDDVETPWRTMKWDGRCGFRSLWQMGRWFTTNPAVYKTLHDEGIVLRKYRVPRGSVLMGDKQVVFDNRKAERVATYDLGNFRAPIHA